MDQEQVERQRMSQRHQAAVTIPHDELANLLNASSATLMVCSWCARSASPQFALNSVNVFGGLTNRFLSLLNLAQLR